MKRYTLLILALLIVGCSRTTAPMQAPEPEARPSWFQAPVQPTSRVLVKLRPGAAALRNSREIPKLGIFVIEARADNVDETLRLMRARPDVEWAEREVLLPANALPNDTTSNQWYLPKIECPGAWVTTVGTAATIAILDTGVDPIHPDLTAHMVAGWNFFDNNSNTSDVLGHGTSVAGIAAAIGDNSIGVVGVAWGARIMPLRISGPDGMASTVTISEALVWAADHGARVANISFGGVSDYLSTGSAAQYFQSKGGVVAVSSGNDGMVSGQPDNPFMLTVSASTNIETIASWSNIGSNIDVAAPGTMLYTTGNGGGYSWFSGTSASAPVVAGVAALVINANPSLTGAQVQQIIKQSADDLGAAGWDQGFGWGRINASRAVAQANGGGSTPTPTATLPASPSPSPLADVLAPVITITNPANGSRIRNAQPVSIRVTVHDLNGVVRVDAYLDGQPIGSSTTAPFTISWVPNMPRKTRANLQAQAIDAAGNTGVTAIVVSR